MYCAFKLIVHQYDTIIQQFMGQSNSNSLTKHQQFLRHFNLQAKNTDHNLTFLEHKQTHQHYVLREMVFNQPRQFCNAVKQLNAKMRIGHPSITKIIKTENEQVQNICSKIFKVYALWQYGSITLADQINARALERRPFELRQIVNLLKSIAQGLSVYYHNGISYECLATKTILISSKSFKIMDPSIFSSQSNVGKVLSNRNIKNIYLSPQECRMIDYQVYSQSLNEKSVVFTAAMIILEAATLQRQNQCYLQRCSRINWSSVKANLDRFQLKYGKELKIILLAMLEQKIESRLNLSSLCKKLREINFKSNKQGSINSARQSFDISRRSERISVIPQSMYNSEKIINGVDSYPQRMIETVYHIDKQNENEAYSGFIQKGPPLMQMKTINTTTNIQPNEPILSFDYELSTNNPFHKNSLATTQDFGNFKTNRISTASNENQNSESTITIKKYPHASETKNMLQKYYVEHFKMGSKYEGYKVNGKRQGWGKFHFQDGGLYQGSWKDNKMHGYGSLYYQSGKIAYEGNWVLDQFEGFGKLYNEKYAKYEEPYNFNNLTNIEEYWIYYQGQFRRDTKLGKGLIRLSNGESYEGYFTNDQIHGQGIYTTMNAKKVNGLWQHGILQKINQIK